MTRITFSTVCLLLAANAVLLPRTAIAFTQQTRKSTFARQGSRAPRSLDFNVRKRTELCAGFLFNPSDRPGEEDNSKSSADDLSKPKADFPTDAYPYLEAFAVSESPVVTETRKERLDIEEKTRERFVHGNELSELREKVKVLTTEISVAQKAGDASLVEGLNDKLRRARLKDAEYVYGQTLEYIQLAELEGRPEAEVEAYRKEAEEVKKCLPHFNLEGLWVGKYGNHGYEMINVTYVDNRLVAYKVTGDKNVPRGEATFLADLSPSFHSGEENSLNAIQLTESASRQWGTKELFRFPGKGQVAAQGYQNAKWMEGQLIMVGEEYFSFAWVPIGIQIFFGRPSAELTLKMMKESAVKKVKTIPVATVNDDVDTMRAFAQHCLEATTQGEECLWLDDDECEEHFQ